MSALLKSYPQGNVKVFFFLHTNKRGEPASKAGDAQVWDNRLKLRQLEFASTLVDKGGKALSGYFGDNKKGNIVLKRGFEVHAVDVGDMAKAVAAAVDAG